MPEPLGPRHTDIATLRRLVGRRSARRDEGRFVVEGPVLVAELCASDLRVDRVYLSVDAEVPDGVPAHLVQPVRAGVLERALDTVTSRGVAAIARIPDASPSDRLARATAEGRPVLVAVEIADPGNLGTIIRAAEASGCAAVLVTDRTVDAWSPKVVRSAAGACFRLPVVAGGTPAEAVDLCDAAGLDTVALVARNGTALDLVDLSGSVALVLGNEAHGLPDEVVAACRARGSIEMEGPTESLNVAMAATIACFEALRQRRAATPVAGRPDAGPEGDN